MTKPSFKFWIAGPNGFEYIGSCGIDDTSPANVENYICIWGNYTLTNHPVFLAVCDSENIAYEYEGKYGRSDYLGNAIQRD